MIYLTWITWICRILIQIFLHFSPPGMNNWGNWGDSISTKFNRMLGVEMKIDRDFFPRNIFYFVLYCQWIIIIGQRQSVQTISDATNIRGARSMQAKSNLHTFHCHVITYYCVCSVVFYCARANALDSFVRSRLCSLTPIYLKKEAYVCELRLLTCATENV